MLHDNKYSGFYRAIVVDNNDPLGAGRVRLKVPQILGENVTAWAWPVGGAIHQMASPYGTFSSTTTQVVSAANTATVVSFSATEDANKTALSGGTKLVVQETGDYFFQFSAQFYHAGSSAIQADIWLRKNGVDIPRTNSRVTLQGNPNEVLITLCYILDMQANDYVELVFSSAATDASIKAYTGLTSPTRPDIPSVIATLNLAGKYVPKQDQAVWAAFEGGDPNFPIWIGAF